MTESDGAAKKKSSAFGIAGGLFLMFVFFVVIVGIPIGLIVGGFQERSVTTPVKGGIETTGTVISVSSDPVTGRGGGSEYPTIRFTDRNGKSWTFEATSVSSAPDPGSTVRVSYDPNNPTHAADLSVGSARWITFVVSGSVLLALEIFYAYWQLRKLRKRRTAA